MRSLARAPMLADNPSSDALFRRFAALATKCTRGNSQVYRFLTLAVFCFRAQSVEMIEPNVGLVLYMFSAEILKMINHPNNTVLLVRHAVQAQGRPAVFSQCLRGLWINHSFVQFLHRPGMMVPQAYENIARSPSSG